MIFRFVGVFVVGILLLGVVYFLLTGLPDLFRYLRIRRM